MRKLISQRGVKHIVSCLLGAFFCLLGWFPPSNDPFRGIYSLMKPTAGIKKGEKVLLLAESTIDPFVLEAVHRALLETGAQVNVINLYGFLELTHPIDLGVKYIFGGGQAIIDFVTEKKVTVQHMDTELYHATY